MQCAPLPKLNERGLRRSIRIDGLGDIVVSLGREGLVLKATGTKLGAHATWLKLVGVCTLPENLPKKFANRPYEFLRFQALTQLKKMNKKLEERLRQEIGASKAG